MCTFTRFLSAFLAGAVVLAGCTHEPRTAPAGAPTGKADGARLTRAEVIRIANHAAEREGIDISRYNEPEAHYDAGPPMHLERLTESESRVVGEALRAAADGPFFPDWEFHTLFGLQREEVRRIASQWPLPLLPPEDVELAVNNSINMLLSYPHRKHEIWADWISVDQVALNELFNRLRGRRNESTFDRLM